MSVPGGPAHGARRLEAACAVLALVALLLFGARTATAPFGNHGVVARMTVYSEIFAAAWDEYGFGRSLGVPMAWVLGDTVADRFPYAHQAPAGWWGPYFGRQIFGRGPLGYRFFPTLFTVLGAALLFLLARRSAGTLWAGAALAVYLARPVTLFYGGLPAAESAAFLAAALFAWLWERRPDRSRVGIPAGLAFLAGTQVAWAFYLLWPGTVLAELFRPPAGRRFAPALRLLPLGTLGAIAVVVHLLIGIGSWEVLLRDLFDTAGEVLTGGLAGNPVNHAPVSFLDAHAAFSVENLGAAGAWLSLAGLLAAVSVRRWRREPLTRVGALFLFQGVLSLVLFNSRSTTHEYYWFLMGPPSAIFLAQGARMLAAALRPRLPVLGLPLAAGALLGVAAFDAARARDVLDELEKPGLEALAANFDALTPPDAWICCMDLDAIEAMLYSRRRWTPPIPRPKELDEILAARSEGRVRFGPLYYYAAPAILAMPLLVPVFEHLERLAGSGRAKRLAVGNGSVVYIL